MEMRFSKVVISAALAASLLGCTQDYKSAKELVDIAVNGLPDIQLSEEERLALNFAAVYIKYGEHPKTYIALAKAQGDERVWAASDGITVVTRNGQIIRSDGLPFASSGVHYLKQDPFAQGLLSVEENTPYLATRDYISEDLFGVTSESSFTVHETSQAVIAGSERQLQRVSEQLSVPALKFSTTNQYWVEQRNNKQIIWRTEQQLGPNQPMVFLESLMPFFEDI
ncbi:YjbF family lipoprotein [Agarivorans sp. TSD2052]|uniref:YjbF family lipoprotein n=1 Tax=Agarivorans sp. TSD2052 TaxID=2937286 RepID=UPI00200BC4F9|nr:YjbF family lipoprotein [Agarivorans sp. TSD2052]UPW20089.1 YjbF family lipoprotein [Agarivorans sp. TSD2052]